MSKKLIQTKLTFSSSKSESATDKAEKPDLKRKLSDNSTEDMGEPADVAKKPFTNVVQGSSGTSDSSAIAHKNKDEWSVHSKSKMDKDDQENHSNPSGFKYSKITEDINTSNKRELMNSQKGSGDEDSDENLESEMSEENGENSNSKRFFGGAALWKGTPINELNRAPDCFKEKNITVPPLRPSSDHKVFFEILNEVWKEDPFIAFPKDVQDIWKDSHVYMPYSKLNKISEYGLILPRWEAIVEALEQEIVGPFELQEAILSYNPHYRRRWNFDALHRFFEEDDEGSKMKEEFFNTTLPAMQRLALQIPFMCPKAMPILKKWRNMKITLHQEQIACLLANAFFCTFPKRNFKAKYSELPDINFSNLYSDCNHNSRKAEKFKCLFNYFQRVTKNRPVGTVTYARRYLPELNAEFWAKSNKKFTRLHVSTTGNIEDEGSGMLQADFANKYVGGGVLGHGLVQEEIRFLICPEMILSRLFTEKLTDKEVLIMTGCERFSNYTGYSDTFRFTGDYEDTTPRDDWGRRYTEVVAMDALIIRTYSSQFERDKVIRELNKAYCAFSVNQLTESLPAICTGNWGCGAFGGDKQLKALIQMMAASAAGRDICYFTFGDSELCHQLGQIHDILMGDGLTISNTLDLIRAYWHRLLAYEKDISLFEFIAKLQGRPWVNSDLTKDESKQSPADGSSDRLSDDLNYDDEDFKADTP